MISSFDSFLLCVHISVRHLGIMKRAPMKTRIIRQRGNEDFKKSWYGTTAAICGGVPWIWAPLFNEGHEAMWLASYTWGRSVYKRHSKCRIQSLTTDRSPTICFSLCKAWSVARKAHDGEKNCFRVLLGGEFVIFVFLWFEFWSTLIMHAPFQSLSCRVCADTPSLPKHQTRQWLVKYSDPPKMNLCALV